MSWLNSEKGGSVAKRGGRRVLFLGCGFGVLEALRETDRMLKTMREEDRDSWSFTVLERREYFTGGFVSQYIVSGRRDEGEWRRAYSNWRYGHFAHLVRDEVLDVDVVRRVVTCRAGQYEYDHLVIGMGSVDQGVPLVKDKVFSICNFEHMRTVRKILAEEVRPGWKILVAVTRMPYKCPPAPFEFAFLVGDLLKKRGLHGQVEVALSFPAHCAVPIENPEVIEQLIRERGLTWIPGCQPTEIEPLPGGRKHKVTWGAHPKFNPNACKCPVPEPFVADLILGTWPQEAPDAIKPFCNEMGYIPVETGSLRSKVGENIYCIGDASWMMLPTKPQPKPHPKAGGFAEGQGRIVMRNILAETPWSSPAPFVQDASCVTACTSETGLNTGKEGDFPHLLFFSFFLNFICSYSYIH